jgi:hypothetical protein
VLGRFQEVGRPTVRKPRTVGHPAGGVGGLGLLIDLELAIRVFANDKFKTEAWGTRPT